PAEGGALALLGGHVTHRVRLGVTRIHPLVEDVHGLTLAGAVHAADQDEHGELLFLEERDLRLQEVNAGRRHALVARGLFDVVTERGGFEHGERQTSYAEGRLVKLRRLALSRR